MVGVHPDMREGARVAKLREKVIARGAGRFERTIIISALAVALYFLGPVYFILPFLMMVFVSVLVYRWLVLAHNVDELEKTGDVKDIPPAAWYYFKIIDCAHYMAHTIASCIERRYH